MLERAIVRAVRWIRWRLAHRRGKVATPDYERPYGPEED